MALNRVLDIEELKQRLSDILHGLEQSAVDGAVDEWRMASSRLHSGQRNTF